MHKPMMAFRISQCGHRVLLLWNKLMPFWYKIKIDYIFIINLNKW
ncbi:hypothetical protein ESA_01079 [Cronobacter sakazakii ATCC BAA-894]|uniref:Uncharacterized protein n=1 Tax=Cronobacter sakazakii (strain ATCC BAA-894) TaxID=290339 RepID=A7MLJ7_CROS8|nr:hypothetical protein ESA_01079 [Cronobacter sakazakii ATCC BAA-894]